MKPNFMSRHIKSLELSCAHSRELTERSKHTCWCCFTIKKFFSPKTNHVFEISTTALAKQKFLVLKVIWDAEELRVF